MRLREILQILEIDTYFTQRDLNRPQDRFVRGGAEWKDVRMDLAEKLLGTEMALKEAQSQVKSLTKAKTALTLDRDHAVTCMEAYRSEIDSFTRYVQKLEERTEFLEVNVDKSDAENVKLNTTLEKLERERGWIYKIRDWLS